MPELLGPELADGRLVPDEIGGRERRHEVVGRPGRLVVVAQGRLDEIETALGGRVDERGLELTQCALRERGEGAERLDLVAEELDPDRLASGRGEDVDDAAADGDLPALLDALRSRVPGQREPLDEPVHARLVADREPDRSGRSSAGGSPSA